MNGRTIIAAVAISLATLLPAQSALAKGDKGLNEAQRFAITQVKGQIAKGKTQASQEFASGNFHFHVHHRGRGRGYNPHYAPGAKHHHGYTVPRGVIRRKLNRRGIHQTSPIYLRGPRYVVHGIGPRGAHLRLAFNAYSGQFIGMRVLQGPRHGWRAPVRY